MEERIKRPYRNLMDTDLPHNLKKVLRIKQAEQLYELIFEWQPEKEYDWYITHSDWIEAILIMLWREIDYCNNTIQSLIELKNMWLDYSKSIWEHCSRLWTLTDIRNKIEDTYFCED